MRYFFRLDLAAVVIPGGHSVAAGNTALLFLATRLQRQPYFLGGAARLIDVMQRMRPANYWKLIEKRYNLKP